MQMATRQAKHAKGECNRTKNEQKAGGKTARKRTRIDGFDKRKHSHKIRKSGNGKAKMETNKCK